MSKNNKVIYLDRRKETKQTELSFHDFLEKILDKDIDKNLFQISIQFKDQMSSIYEANNISRITNQSEMTDWHKLIDDYCSDNKLKKVENNDSIEIFYPKEGSKKTISQINNLFQLYEKQLDLLVNSLHVTSDALYVLLFSKFESNIQYLFDIYLKATPEMIPEQYEEEFSFKYLKENFTKISEVEDFVHKKIMEKIMFMSYSKRLKWMNKHLDYKLDEIDRKLFDELLDIRNCIVHNNSFVTKDRIKDIFYILEKHPDFSRYINDDFNSDCLEDLEDVFLIGSQDELSRNLFYMCFTLLDSLGFKAILAFWTKLKRKTDSDHLYFINTHIYSLITEEKTPQVSNILFKNLQNSNLKKIHSDEIDSLLLYSQSLKENDDDKYLRILDELDWSALSENYILIKYGILDDVDSVINFMKDLSKNDSMKFMQTKHLTKNILKGSFFWNISQDPKFLNAYEETFKETFEYSILL